MTSLKIRNQNLRMRKTKRSSRWRLPYGVTDLPTGVQKSYFMLSEAERAVLNTALEKYRPGQSEPIFVGGHKVLKPALRLMKLYLLTIEEIKDSRAIMSYTRWVDAVHVTGSETEQVYVTFSPRFEHIWLASKKRLLDYLAQKPDAIRLRSKYAVRLYAWAKDHASLGSKRVTLEQLRTVLGLDSVKDSEGNVIREAALAAWANFRNRALDTAVSEINKKADLNIRLVSREQSRHGRIAALTLAIKAQAVPNGHSSPAKSRK
jgi:plasmid replication initiation protein